MYELQLEIPDVEEQLDEDTKLRMEYANEKIESLVNYVRYSIFTNFDTYALADKYLSDDIPDWRNSTGHILSSVIQDEIDEINFYDTDPYRWAEQLFMSYCGLSVCESPFYNHKN